MRSTLAQPCTACLRALHYGPFLFSWEYLVTQIELKSPSVHAKSHTIPYDQEDTTVKILRWNRRTYQATRHLDVERHAEVETI